MDGIVNKIVGATVGMLLIGYLGVEGLKALINSSGIASTSPVHTLLTTVLPIIGVVVFLVIILAYVTRGKK